MLHPAFIAHGFVSVVLMGRFFVEATDHLITEDTGDIVFFEVVELEVVDELVAFGRVREDAEFFQGAVVVEVDDR